MGNSTFKSRAAIGILTLVSMALCFRIWQLQVMGALIQPAREYTQGLSYYNELLTPHPIKKLTGNNLLKIEGTFDMSGIMCASYSLNSTKLNSVRTYYVEKGWEQITLSEKWRYYAGVPFKSEKDLYFQKKHQSKNHLMTVRVAEDPIAERVFIYITINR